MPESPTYSNALSLGSMLLEYRLETVLGAGGFGMTYLGWDTNLEKHVAIKEYLPGELAIRALDGSIVPVNTESEYNYKWGLERFIQEARTLAKFSHPNIVRVNRFFEANGTSYMVMDYEAGESLHQYLRRLPMPEEAVLKGILMPILDGLQAVHQIGFLHRDIKPSNVFIRENGAPVLLDFGSARMTTRAPTKSMTAIVTPGYAPLEQYASDGNQGPWSDIYALSGVMYRAITSENPPDAVRRMKADSVPHSLAAARSRYSERFLKAVEWGLTIDERMRPQSIADWRDLFLGRAPVTAFSRGPSAASLPRTVTLKDSAPTIRAADTASRASRTVAMRRTSRPGGKAVGSGKWLIAGGVALIALALVVALSKRQPPAAQTAATRSIPPAQSTAQTAPAAESPAAQPQTVSPPEVPAAPVSPPAAKASPATTATDSRAPQMVEPAGSGANSDNDSQIPLSVKKEFFGADRDRDGYLSLQEVRGRFPYIERNFSTVDIDRDGRISLGELWQLRKKRQGVKPRS